MSTAPVERAPLPPRQSERRRMDPIQEPIPFDREAGAVALRAARAAFETGQGLDAAVLAGALAFERVKREKARRGAFFPLRDGQRLEGVSPAMVQAATTVLMRWGGQAPESSIEEEALARAIAAANADQARRAAEASAEGRRLAESDRASTAFEAVRERVRIHRTVYSSARR